MSKGGAGKVYFVLYLAVILELLIIIVERDEAEEHLMAKQKESMRIVESILSQLQVGAGTEGINTRPLDLITLPPVGVNVKEVLGADLKPDRKYLVEVGITDVSTALKQTEVEEPNEYLERMKRFLRLSNVADLKYEILYSNQQSDEKAPDSNSYSLKATTELSLDHKGMEQDLENLWSQQKGDQRAFLTSMQELLKSPRYAPVATTGFKPSKEREEYYYSKGVTDSLGKDATKKRSFVVNFEPKEAGWYKLRFSSRTNKILGVSIKEGQGFELDPEEKVNIGTVQLKVKDLIKVREELEKTTDNLPSAELARTNISDFDAKLDELARNTDDLPMKSRIRLYGYIVKLTTPGISSENAFEQNKGQIEFTIRVVKPTPQITDPKIADLETTVRVFDKLSKIVLPMQVTPANGKTEIVKNPGGARVSDGGATASSSSGAGTKWVGKNLEIPVTGNLTPRDEPYVFELIQTNGSKRSEPIQCSVYVYPSTISNADLVNNALEAAWGDALELVVTPSSGNTIKPNEFVMQFNMGGGSQIAPLRKLNIQSTDNIIVPAGTDKVQLNVGWKDPRTGEVVEIYSGSGEVGLKKPTIVTTDMRADPITDQSSGEFIVKGFSVKAPMISESDRANVGKVDVQVSNATIKDMRSGQTYKATVVGKARKSAGSDYEVTLKLTGGKFPLTRGQVKGSVTVTISATSTAEGSESKPRMITKTVSVSN
jgi:hypothetical protein